MLFVRTEERPGADGPEHFFVETTDRLLLERWVSELPEGFDLAYDPEATGRADRIERELREARAEVEALAAAMKRAVAVVPQVVASDLRRIYRETKGEALTR